MTTDWNETIGKALQPLNNLVRDLRAENAALRARVAELTTPKPISQCKPKPGDKILGYCVHSANPYQDPENPNRLTTYAAHCEGLNRVNDGWHVLVWGGEYHENGDGYIPNWWFLADDNWETPANPIFYLPVPDVEGKA